MVVVHKVAPLLWQFLQIVSFVQAHRGGRVDGQA